MRASTHNTQSAHRFLAVDAARGWAALGVCLAHMAVSGLMILPAGRTGQIWMIILSQGVQGVPLFLAISGFCLMWPLVKDGRPLRQCDLGDVREYYLRRARRILPPYYAALAITAATAYIFPLLLHRPNPLSDPTAPPPPLWDLGAHLLLVHNLSTSSIGTFSQVFWSMALEWQIYLLLPLLLPFLRRAGWAWSLVLVILLGLGSQLWAVSTQGTNHENVPTRMVWFWNLPGMLSTWLLGAAAAYLVSRQDARSAALRRRFSLPIAALSLTIAFCWAGISETFCDPWRTLLWAIGFAAALVTLFEARPHPGISRPLAAVGRVSYSLYLVHLSVIYGYRALLAALHYSRWDTPAHFFLVGVPAIAVITWLFYIACERPFTRRPKADIPIVGQATVQTATATAS